jgi:hypothetical protein
MFGRSIKIVLLLAALAAPAAFAQSGRVTPGGNGRSNERPPVAAPTSTPAAVVVPAVSVSDPPPSGTADDDVIKVETQLVSVPIRVMDKKGRFVAGLTRDNFTVTEDGVSQQISLFSNEHEPFTVALVLDMSYSTTFKIAEIQSAAIAFINDLNNLDDAMELDALIYTIRYDTFADVQAMKNGTVLGGPPTIRDTMPPIGGIPGGTSPPRAGTPGSQGTTAEEYRRAEEYLDALAVRTGGRRYDASTLGNLAAAYSRIASELREFYSIGYYPATERVAGRRTNIKVRVDRPGLVVRAREGYFNRRDRQRR